MFPLVARRQKTCFFVIFLTSHYIWMCFCSLVHVSGDLTENRYVAALGEKRVTGQEIKGTAKTWGEPRLLHKECCTQKCSVPHFCAPFPSNLHDRGRREMCHAFPFIQEVVFALAFFLYFSLSVSK